MSVLHLCSRRKRPITQRWLQMICRFKFLELTPDLMLQTAHQLAMASGSQIELVLKILERQTTRCREAKEIQMRMRSQAAAALI